MSYVYTVLPRYLPPGNHPLTQSEYLQIYNGYCERLQVFLEKYGRMSLGFCTGIYAHGHGDLFPQEWEEDIEGLLRQPHTFQKVLELQEDVLKCLDGFPAISSFVEEAYMLSFSRVASLSGEELDTIASALRRTDLPWVQLLLTESKLNKALEVLITALVSDVVLEDSTLSRSLLTSLEANDIDPYVEYYFRRKIEAFEHVRSALHMTRRESHDGLINNNNYPIELDLGAGKGYFSLFRQFGLERPVIAVEASVTQLLGLIDRSKTLIKRGILPEDALTQLLAAPLCLDASVSGSRIERAAMPALEVETRGERHITGSNIQGPCFPRTAHFALECATAKTTSNSYCVVGLHACGGLSRLALQLLQQLDIVAAITFPCCYGHIHTSEHFPCTDGGRRICTLFNRPEFRELAPPHYPGGPPRLLLSYAGSGFQCPPAQTHKDLESFMNRATVEYMRVNLLEDSTKRMLPRQGDRSLSEWMRSVASGVKDLEEQDIMACIRHCQSRRWQMGAHYLVRKLLGQVFETFILLDRLAWLNSLTNSEEGVVIHSSCFAAMTELSARGFCLLATRATGPWPSQGTRSNAAMDKAPSPDIARPRRQT